MGPTRSQGPRREVTSSPPATERAGVEHQNIDQLEVIKQAHQGLPRALRPGYAEAKAEARKLLDWQRWSNNEIRRRLCDDLEALPEAGLHPE